MFKTKGGKGYNEWCKPGDLWVVTLAHTASFLFSPSHSVYNALSLRLHLSVRPKRLIKTEEKNAFPWSKLLLFHLRIERKV